MLKFHKTSFRCTDISVQYTKYSKTPAYIPLGTILLVNWPEEEFIIRAIPFFTDVQSLLGVIALKVI